MEKQLQTKLLLLGFVLIFLFFDCTKNPKERYEGSVLHASIKSSEIISENNEDRLEVVYTDGMKISLTGKIEKGQSDSFSFKCSNNNCNLAFKKTPYNFNSWTCQLCPMQNPPIPEIWQKKLKTN